jgi:ent-kaurene oxidase
VDIQQIFRRLVSRMSAKVFMGYPACRDEDWLNLSIGFTHDMFVAAFTLRMFPPWTHRYIASLVPARRRMWHQIKTAE